MACLFLATSYKGSSLTDYYFALADALVARGHRVVIAVDKQRHDVVRPEANPAIVTWPSIRPTTWRDALFFRDLHRQEQFEGVLSNFASVNVVTLMGRWLGIPRRGAWYHTLSSQLASDSRRAGWITRLLSLRKSFVYRRATTLWVSSTAAAEDLQANYGVTARKCRVLPFLIPDPAEKLARPVARIADRVVCVGRLHRSKGQDLLLRALAQLKTNFPQLTAEFVGAGPLEDEYRRLASELGIADLVQFSGAVPPERVFEKMASATVCVSPSRSEAFGLVNIETQALGTPVVAASVGGIREIIESNVTGLLVPADDVPSLSAALTNILSDAPLRERLSRAARERFETHFCLSRIDDHARCFEEWLTS